MARQNFGLWQVGGRSVFVGIAEDEFTGLEGSTSAWCRHFAGALDDRLREPITVTKVVMCIIERRSRLEVQRRQHLNAFTLCDELVMLDLAARALGAIASEKDCDGVKIWAGKFAQPVVRMIL